MKRILLALLVLAACRRETPVTETTAPQTTTQAAATATAPAAAIPQHEAERPAARVASFADIPESAPTAKRRAAQSFGAIETSSATCVKRTIARRVPAGTTEVRVTLAGKATSVVRQSHRGDEWTIDFNAPCPNEQGSIALEFVGSSCACGTDEKGVPVRCPCGVGLAWIPVPVTQAKKVPQ